jgi:hypothetical protein
VVKMEEKVGEILDVIATSVYSWGSSQPPRG